jgi:hypothetical protein
MVAPGRGFNDALGVPFQVYLGGLGQEAAVEEAPFFTDH